MEQPEGIVGVFDRAAETYDAVGVPWFGPIAQGLVDALAPQPGERALDIGCGRGAATRPLADAVGPHGEVLAVDLAPRMVARTAADLAHLGHVRVQVADAGALEVPAGWDVIASSLVLFFLPDPAAAVAAWTRLLSPGGRLGVATFGPQGPDWKQIDEVFLASVSQDVREARAHGRQGPFASDAGVEQLLTDAGLTGVRTVSTVLSSTFTDREQWHAFSWSHGQRAMWEAIPESERETVKQRCFALLGARSTWSQEVRYTLGRRA